MALYVASALTLCHSLTFEDIVNTRKVQEAVISPDGDYIAYLVSKPRLAYVDLPGKDWNELFIVNKKGKIRPFITGEKHIRSLQWSSDSKQIWMLMGSDAHPKFELYAMPVDGGEPHKILSRSNDIKGFHLGLDSEKLIFWYPQAKSEFEKKMARLGFNASVFEEDQRLNQLWLLDFSVQPLAAKLLIKDKHTLYAELSESGDKILLKSAPSKLVDDKISRPQLSTHDITGKQIVSIEHVGKMGRAKLSPNGKHVAFIGSNDIHSPDHGQLFITSTSTGKTQLLLEGFKGFVSDIAWNNNSKVYFTADKGVRSIIGLKGIGNPGRHYKTINKNRLIYKSINSNGKSDLAVIAHSKAHPPEVFWMKKDNLLRVSETNSHLGKSFNHTQEIVEFKGEDGLEMEGILVSPKDAGNKALPLILFVHGGPESHYSNGWLSHYTHPAYLAATKGYRSFFPNYRGSSGYGPDFLKLGQKDYAGKEFDDLIAAKNHLVQAGLVDTDKVAIAGASYGGYAAAWGATKYSKHFAAAVMLAGISNKVSKYGTTDIATEMVNTHALQHPWDDWMSLFERSPIFHGASHQTPLLITHGKKDTRVHYSQSLELYRHLKVRNQAPVRLVLYPQQGHGNSTVTTKLDYTMRLMRWIDHFVLDGKQSLPPHKLPHSNRAIDE